MSTIIQKLKLPVILIVLCGALYFVYVTYVKNDPSQEQLQTTAESNSVPEEEQQFLSLLLKIQNISIDAKVFDDPVFASLQDDGLSIIDQPKGRRNPFAPISANEPGGTAGTNGTSTVQ
jgi:hypothetical protein